MERLSNGDKRVIQEAWRLHKSKQFEKALLRYDTLPQSNPTVMYDKAVCLVDCGGLPRLIEAVSILAKIKNTGVGGTKEFMETVDNTFVSYTTMLINAYVGTYRMDDALRVNYLALQMMPNNFIFQYNQGHLLKCKGRMAEALPYLEKSLSLNPMYFDTYITQINIYMDMGKYPMAEAVIRKGISVMPKDPRLYNELGVCLGKQNRFQEGFKAFEDGINMPGCPGDVAGRIYTNAGNMYSILGDTKGSLDYSRKGFECDPKNVVAMQNYLMTLLYLYQNPYNDTLRKHLEVGGLLSKQLCVKEFPVQPYPPPLNSKIRMGFVSADFFGEHPMTYFLKALFRTYSRDRFEYYCYSNTPIGDTTVYSPEIKWRTIKYLATQAVCKQIVNDDKIDVLVDLSGHTAGSRADIFSNRCARLQISYLGYPCITGLPEVDYMVIDRTFGAVLKCVYMPHCFTHYTPKRVPDPSELSSPHSKDKDGTFYLGTLNKLAKVNQPMVDLWDRILDEFPNVKLVVRRNYVYKFRHPERVVMLEQTPTYEAHLARYGQIDVALDTAPYSGTTTTCEALLMGTPVVTMTDRKNRSVHQNVSASILINSGLGRLAVDSEEEYLALIRTLMKEISEDPGYKVEYQKKFLQGSVCNAKEYVGDFETLVEELDKKASNGMKR